ncbi:hypothetical protein QBC42DRAFT_304514 [Cladorrhinum samala]|uniref:Heterokaryon incompatibility domain-containing protein n=1 Tax=Cladorrhinum samala TaxID=585594 RepID=A0AAV9HWN6_9PEZI|nr:hypothetical protein QBC42DRAFT_304514 [Cladorrhinum samala]
MRLININTLKLEEFLDYETPRYAILSHTWGDDAEELSFRDVDEGRVDKPGIGSVKLRGCCRQAEQDGFGYVWIDTCCIDKANLVELSEAINSMFRWYKRASCCYAYLSDVPEHDVDPRQSQSSFRQSRWFTRGWTLQELLAPKSLRFYNSAWIDLGTKGTLRSIVGNVTGIPVEYLLGISELGAASVAQRLSWAAKRQTKRREDLAYCLLGIFGVSMPMIYGEGGTQAFLRLQEHIMRTTRDDSMLAWGIGPIDAAPSLATPPVSNHSAAGRAMATSPSQFATARDIVSCGPSSTSPNSLEVSGGAIRIILPLLTTGKGETFGLLNCGPESDNSKRVAIPLAKVEAGANDEYVRPEDSCAVLRSLPEYWPSPQLIYIKNDINMPSTHRSGNQQFLLYDQFTELDFELIDVHPRSCWDQERAVLMFGELLWDKGSRYTLVRFRHSGQESPDLLVVIEPKHSGKLIDADSRCHVVTCSRDTSLQQITDNAKYVRRRAAGSITAADGNLHLQVMLRAERGNSVFSIKPEPLPDPAQSARTVDITEELKKLEALVELEEILEERKRVVFERFELGLASEAKADRFAKIKTERQALDSEIKKLEERRNILAEQEKNEAAGIQLLMEQSQQVEEKHQGLTSQWEGIQSQWGRLCRRGPSGEASERSLEPEECLSLLHWAAEHDQSEMVELLLLQNKVGHGNLGHALLAASRKGYPKVVRVLIAGGVDVEFEDPDTGQTSLSLACANGCLAAAIPLIRTGKARLDSRDKLDRTPLWWAMDNGHLFIVKLLRNSSSGPNTLGHSHETRRISLSRDVLASPDSATITGTEFPNRTKSQNSEPLVFDLPSASNDAVAFSKMFGTTLNQTPGLTPTFNAAGQASFGKNTPRPDPFAHQPPIFQAAASFTPAKPPSTSPMPNPTPVIPFTHGRQPSSSASVAGANTYTYR